MTTLRERAMEALARATAATEGPWEAEPSGGCARVETSYITDSGVDMDGITPWEHRGTIAEAPEDADREFIAHAREDVPALARAVISLSDRVDALEETLKLSLPKCDCGALATRGALHCSGHFVEVCDNDKCMEEEVCDECGQLWFPHNGKCSAFKGGGIPCTGASAHGKNLFAEGAHDLFCADVVRSFR